LANIKIDTMNKSEIVGIWQSKDFPIYTFNDGIVITLYVANILNSTLWKIDSKGVKEFLAEGKIDIIPVEDDVFSLVFEGKGFDERYKNIPLRLYIKKEPPSFLLNILELGERYFQKIR